MVPVTTTMMVWLLQACNHVISVKQEQVGIERCKRQCARYNKCYGIEYNPATITCRILNNRHTDGDVMLLSRKDILQNTSIGHLDIAPPRYESLRRIVSKEGHTVDISAQQQSEEIVYVGEIFNMSSLHNCKTNGDRFSSPNYSAYETHFCSAITRAFPGKRYLTAFVVRYQEVSARLVFTMAFSNAQTFPVGGANWTIRYHHNTYMRRLEAYYLGPGSHASKTLRNNGTSSVYYCSFLIDRSPAGDVLHDMDYFTQVIRGSIKGLNLNQPVWLAVQVEAPNTDLWPASNIYGQTLFSARRSLQQWYKKPNI